MVLLELLASQSIPTFLEAGVAKYDSGWANRRNRQDAGYHCAERKQIFKRHPERSEQITAARFWCGNACG